MGVPSQSAEQYPGDIKSVLLSSDQVQARAAELGAQVGEDYREAIAASNEDLLLITVLKGAVFFVTDLALREWMGLIAYRATGRIDELLPGPAPK